MKTNKYILFILAFAAIFANETSYTSQVDKENTRIPIFNNQNYSLNSEDSFDEIQSKKESLLDLIQEIKTSSNYIDSSEEIKLLYDNSVIFNSRAIETDNAEWISYSFNNLKEDIDTIEKLKHGDFDEIEDFNQDSLFFNNPKYKIPYLKLSMEKQDILDELIKDNTRENPLSISDLINSDNEDLLIFFSDWLYPFMDDTDKDGAIINTQALLDSIKANKDLFESYRNTNFDLRDILEDNSLNNNNTRIENLTLMNLLTISTKTNILDDENLEISNDNKSSETLLVPETVILGNYNPISITDNDSSNVITSNIDKINEFKSSNTEDDDLVNTSLTDSSIFSTNKKTKEAYSKLSDEQKQILNTMNTDGKYPLTIAEVKKSGLFSIPVKNTVWIYPFMMDRNNSGEVGEYDGEFDDMEPSENTNPSPELITSDEVSYDSEIIDNNVVTNSSEFVEDSVVTNSPVTYTNTEPTTTTYEVVSKQNVKTGIKGLKSIIIILIMAIVAYYSSKKYSIKSKNNNY